MSVVITGANFGLNPQVLAGTGIFATVDFQTTTQINATFAIDGSTAPGERGISVRSLGLTGTGFTPLPGISDTSNQVPFNVTAGTGDVDLPTIASIENKSVREVTLTVRNAPPNYQTRITLENPPDASDGKAVFEGGQTEFLLTGAVSRAIRIKGEAGSKDKDNIRLVATHGPPTNPTSRRETKSFEVSWVEFGRKDDCDGFDDHETMFPTVGVVPTNYLLVGTNLTRQARARVRPNGATGNFRLDGVVNTFTVTPTAITSTNYVDISVTAAGTAVARNFDLNAVAAQAGVTAAASRLPIVIRRRIDRQIVEWKIIEDNDDVQDVRVGQGSPNRVAFIILPGPNNQIDSLPGGDDFLGYGPPGSYPPEYRKNYARLRRAFTGENGLVETVVSGDDVIYNPPAGTVTGGYTYNPDDPYVPFNPVIIGDGTPYGACVSSGVNLERDTNKSGDDVEDFQSGTGLPIINSGLNGRCQTEANDDDVPSGTPVAATPLEQFVNNVVWGQQANIYIDVNRMVLEKEVNYDKNRDGKLTNPSEDPAEFFAIKNAFNSGLGNTRKIDMYYIGMPYAPWLNPETGQIEVAIAATQRNQFTAIFGNQGQDVVTAGHELGHAFNAFHRYNQLNPNEYLGYLMYPTQQTTTPCRTGKPDWDEVQPPTP